MQAAELGNLQILHQHVGKTKEKPRNCWSMEKTVKCVQRTSFWISAKFWPFFKAIIVLWHSHQQSITRNTLCITPFQWLPYKKEQN